MQRRKIIRALCGGALAAAGAAVAQERLPASQPPAAGPPPPSSPTEEGPITPADVAAATRLSGRTFSEAQRTQMVQRLGGVRSRLRILRDDPSCERHVPALHFEPRLPSTPLPKGPSGATVSRGKTPARPSNLEELAFLPAVDLSRLLRARRVTSVQLTRMYLERLKRLGPRLECVVTLTEELALRQAARADEELAAGKYRGPLHGIPWGAKDLLATRGIPTTWGAAPYRNQIPDEDATVVKRLEAAGAVLVAKLTTGELAVNDVWFGGKTRNPWRPSEGSSGSSAGPGSATAAGLVGFSIGTETLGSIVSPSVVNGVTGLRPTFGRVPRTGCMSLCWSLDKIGPMTRGVEDAALVLHAIFGPDGTDRTVPEVPFRWQPPRSPREAFRGLRVGLDRAAFEVAGRNMEEGALYQAALEVLRGLGVEFRDITLPRVTPAFNSLAGTVIDVESAAAFWKLTESGRSAELVGQAVGSWPNTFRVGATVPAVDYLAAMRVRTELQYRMAEALKDVDLYLTVPRTGPTIFYTNLTGHPTLVTRCGERAGMPRMLEFVGQLYREDQILRAAWAFEQATEWHTRWPRLEGV